MKKLIILILGIIIFISCRGKSEKENDIQKTTPVVTKEIVVPHHTIIQENDKSFQSAKRLQVKLRVQEVLAEEEIKAICNKLIPKYKILKYNAIIFHFYLPDSDINGTFTAGMAEWAPYGNWSQAGNMKKGDYSKYSLSIKVSKPVAWEDKTDIPIEKRKKIFYDIVAEEDRLYDLGVKSRSSKAASTIAKKYNLTVEQVKKIGSEGVVKNWPMP